MNQIRVLKQKNTLSNFKIKNHNLGDANSYASHMGFFKLLISGVEDDSKKLLGNYNYTPIRILNVRTIKRRAREKIIQIEDELESNSKDIALKLIRTNDETLIRILEYSILEIFRNILDHSGSTKLAYCAQFCPSKNKIEVAILDNGVGILKSLSKNPFLKGQLNDQNAIEISLLPGISGKMFKGIIPDPYDKWQNSGYGLYITSEICKAGGSFFICSNNQGILLRNSYKKKFQTKLNGTAIRLIINLDKIPIISDSLKKIRKSGLEKAKTIDHANITPSISSSSIFE